MLPKPRIHTSFLLISLLTVSACGGLQVGEAQGVCESTDECMSAREAHAASNGFQPIPGDGGKVTPVAIHGASSSLAAPGVDAVALTRGDAMRVWIAPRVDQAGNLHGSNYTHVPMDASKARWDVGQNNYFWTGRSLK